MEIILILIVLVIALASQRGYDRRLRKLEHKLEELTLALAEAASPMTAATAIAGTAQATEPLAETVAGVEPEPVVVDPWAVRDVAIPASAIADDGRPAGIEPEPLAAAGVTPAAAAGKPRESLESWLGARWAVWVGGLALALGGIFMIKYSIESGLLSPAVRLSMAAVFGAVLVVAGEVVRRRAVPVTLNAFQNAMIPGILTAAGAVTLFGCTYAAHGIYGYIGPSAAFIVLGLLALATLGLSLLHGQALAGLGLLGSMATPLLVSSNAPNIPALFGFLTIMWVATAAASRLRGWTIVPMLANIGLSLWAIASMATAETMDLLPVTIALLAMIAGVIFLWPGRAYRQTALVAETGNQPAKPTWQPNSWEALAGRQPLAITLSLSIGIVAATLMMLMRLVPATVDPRFCFAAVIAALGALGASRLYAPMAAAFAAIGAIAGGGLIAISSLYPTQLGLLAGPSSDVAATGYGTDIAVSLGLGVVFAALGVSFLWRHGRAEPHFSAVWAALMTGVPLANGCISFFNFGDLARDWTHGLYGVFFGFAFLCVAEFLASRDRGAEGRDGADTVTMAWLVGGSFAAFAFALHALTHGAVTTVGLAILGFAYVAATRLRPWAALPWMMAAAGVLVLARIAWQPTIVGAEHLGTTPVFNALLAGYGIPALLTALAAFELRHWPQARIRNLLQALASLMLLLTVAILVRHAMNGGSLAGGAPTLGEQSIYTLLTIGASGIMMTLDRKSPSPVFRIGSMVVGALSMLSILAAHFIALNPFVSGENTGSIPFFNLLLIGYLLPALAYAGLAVYARGKRPLPYVILLALSGAALGFAWATLSVRRFWQGENIAAWKGFLQGETYTYSVVWLLIGVALLGLGSRFDAKSLRLASAGLVLIAVVKVFLIDMANLEGFLRALSFIGLGAVLIGIGLFYQKILTGKTARAQAGDTPA